MKPEKVKYSILTAAGIIFLVVGIYGKMPGFIVIGSAITLLYLLALVLPVGKAKDIPYTLALTALVAAVCLAVLIKSGIIDGNYVVLAAAAAGFLFCMVMLPKTVKSFKARMASDKAE